MIQIPDLWSPRVAGGCVEEKGDKGGQKEGRGGGAEEKS